MGLLKPVSQAPRKSNKEQLVIGYL
jgi:hypothetical protein